MMNRILKRPMFRMGGRSDDGIMSIRPGYQEGDLEDGPIVFMNTAIQTVDICLKENEEECDFNSILNAEYEEINGIPGYQDGIVLKLIKQYLIKKVLEKNVIIIIIILLKILD